MATCDVPFCALEVDHAGMRCDRCIDLFGDPFADPLAEVEDV